MTEAKGGLKGKVVAIIFLAILILPVSYAIYKERMMKKSSGAGAPATATHK